MVCLCVCVCVLQLGAGSLQGAADTMEGLTTVPRSEGLAPRGGAQGSESLDSVR